MRVWSRYPRLCVWLPVGHIQESTNEYKNKWSNKLEYLSLSLVAVYTLTRCISLCCVFPAEHIHAYVHPWMWPNAPAFFLPDWGLLLAPSFLLGHWVTHHCIRLPVARDKVGRREHVHLCGNRTLPISVIQFIYLVTFASIHWFTTYICVRASMCLSLCKSLETQNWVKPNSCLSGRITQTQLWNSAGPQYWLGWC